MKDSDLIVLGLAGVAAYFILQQGKPKPAASTAPAAGHTGIMPHTQTREIFAAGGVPFPNGWRYFNDGTSISPSGEYFKGGQLLWAPSMDTA